MNCWKIINVNKDHGKNRVYLQSLLTGLLAFIVLFVPFSIKHGATTDMNDSGLIPLTIMVGSLPLIHSFTHILPLMMLNKRARLIYKRHAIFFPIINYYTKKRVKKKVSLLAALSPTLLITIPGIIGAYLFSDYYVYLLIFTSAHIAMSFADFLYIVYIADAPKQSIIENRDNEITILVRNEKKSAG